MTQCDRLLKRLQEGPVTPMQAWNELGIYRLAPRVLESPAAMECKLLQAVYTSRRPGGGVIVVGEIVQFHVRADIFDNFRVDPAGLDAVGRMAGNTWVRTRDRVEHQRPR